MSTWIFWLVTTLGAIACLLAVFAPLLRGALRDSRRASHDLQVIRDQLREIESDQARGVLSAEEAEATRVEVSRRLIAAADAEAAEAAARAAPRGLGRRLGPIFIAAALLAGVGIYKQFGSPGLGDQPRAERLAHHATARANRPDQAAAEAIVAAGAAPRQQPDEDVALVERLREALRDRPQDLEGHRLLARSLAALDRWPEARSAQADVVEILGEDVGAQDLVDLAELGILAAGGYVSPQSEAVLDRARALDPTHPVGRYYSALTLMQAGRPDLAAPLWIALVQEGPPDAPWIAASRKGAGEAARLAGMPLPEFPGTTEPTTGLDAEALAAAEAMKPEERQAMIEGMVGRLADRLAREGGPPSDWARLIRALGVLGHEDEAAAILGEAREVHAGDAAGLAEIEGAAGDAGLTE